MIFLVNFVPGFIPGLGNYNPLSRPYDVLVCSSNRSHLALSAVNVASTSILTEIASRPNSFSRGLGNLFTRMLNANMVQNLHHLKYRIGLNVFKSHQQEIIGCRNPIQNKQVFDMLRRELKLLIGEMLLIKANAP